MCHSHLVWEEGKLAGGSDFLFTRRSLGQIMIVGDKIGIQDDNRSLYDDVGGMTSMEDDDNMEIKCEFMVKKRYGYGWLTVTETEHTYT